MNITRRFGLGVIAVLSGMRGVGKNLAVQCRKKRENSTATYCSAFIANHPVGGLMQCPMGGRYLPPTAASTGPNVEESALTCDLEVR